MDEANSETKPESKAYYGYAKQTPIRWPSDIELFLSDR